MTVPNGLGFSAKHSVRTLHSKHSEHVLSYVVAAKFITHLYYSFISSQAISAENMPSFDTGTRPDFYLKDQMVSRCKYESSSEVGAYARITNSFVLLPLSASPQFAQPFLQMDLPVVRCNIAGTAIVGRLTVGNKHGIIVPCTTTHAELATLRESLPDGVAIEQVEERLSALGNVISCNDKVALVHPELDAETIAVIEDVLQVQTFPAMIANEPVVGSYSVFTNRGGVVSPDVTVEQLHELSEQVGVSLEAATVNRGMRLVSAGLCVNDKALVVGMESTALEVASLSRIFKIDESTKLADFDNDLLDSIL